MKLFLIGMPGSGKTSLGRALAEHILFPFTDLDEYIESKYKQSVGDIFRLQGEATFRLMEAEALNELLSLSGDQVIATGGGTACLPQAMESMNAAGITVWLNVSPAQLEKRLTDQAGSRPLLQTDALDIKLRELFRARIPCYQKSRITLDIEQEDIPELIHRIREYISL